MIILLINFSDNMSDKTYLYEWKEEDLKDLSNIEIKAFRKADDLNDKLLDIKILMDEIAEDWMDFMEFLEDEKISKICEFRGQTCIDFDEELLDGIVNTLKKSLDDTKRSLDYNSKKIALNLVIEG